MESGSQCAIFRGQFIRWIHDGGAFFPSRDPKDKLADDAYRSLVSKIETLLAEP